MPDRIFGDREKAMEEAFFRQEDARLLEKLRQKAGFDEIALALDEKLQVDNPELLQRVREAGISLDTAPALFLAPLVQVAWAGGVAKGEHDTVLRIARDRGIETDSPAYAQLEEWLRIRPADALFELAVAVIKYGLSVLPPAEKEERIQRIVDACRETAKASQTKMLWVLGLFDSVTSSEESVLDTITTKLRRPERSS